MELTEGFKRTEIGLIPQCWSVSTISACARTSSGTTPARANASRYFHNGTIPWVKTLDLNNSVIESTDECVTTAALRETSLRLYPAGSVLVAMYGGFAQIGRTGLLAQPATVNQALTAICPEKEQLDSRYLLHVLNHRVDHWKSVASSSRKDPNITGVDVKKFPIALPAIEEQRTIAAALSDADALIAGLERLIAKKRDLKQAAMQQLLTGKTRLPGFASKWAAKRIGEIGKAYGGLIGKTKSDFGHGNARYVTFLSVMAGVVIDCNALDRVRIKPSESQNRVLSGDLIFNGSSETPEEVAMCSLLQKQIPDLYLNSFCFGFRIKPEARVHALYLAYFMRSGIGREMMKSLAQGSTRYNLSKASLLETSIVIPGLAEQTAIATVLSDMDAELAALEARLAKTRAIKQGMMQELLTGKTRLA